MIRSGFRIIIWIVIDIIVFVGLYLIQTALLPELAIKEA